MEKKLQMEIDSAIKEASELDQNELYRMLGQATTGAEGEVSVQSARVKLKGMDFSLIEGKKIFNRFNKKFKKVICGKGGPYEQFKDGLLSQEKLPQAVVAAVLAGSSGIPLMVAVYFALLLTKTGLKMYCEK